MKKRLLISILVLIGLTSVSKAGGCDEDDDSGCQCAKNETSPPPPPPETSPYVPPCKS